MKSLFSVAVLLVATHSASAAVYTGEIEKITEPIILHLAPYTASDTWNADTTITANNKNTSFILSASCNNEIKEKSLGFTRSGSCEMTLFDSRSQVQYSEDISSEGKISNIQITTDNTEWKEKIESMVKNQYGTSACNIGIPLVTDSEFCKTDWADNFVKAGLKLQGTPSGHNKLRGWGQFEGKRVLVTESDLAISATTKDGVQLTITVRGYQLVDPKTAATMFFDTEMSIEGTMGNEIQHVKSKMSGKMVYN